jgi:hypothetical protein
MATLCFTGFPARTSAEMFFRNAALLGDLTKGIFYLFFAVFADSLNALAVGAPFVPGFRIFSPEPALIRACLAWMLLYRPGFVAIFSISIV